MQINVVINQVIILFLILFVGFYARKRNIITADMPGKLSNLMLQVTLPLQILSSFNFGLSKEILRNAFLLFVLSFLIHLFLMVIAKFAYLRYQEPVRNVLKYMTIFSNCGFMGFPVLQSIFGSKGVFYGAFYNIPFQILTLYYGVMIFTGKSDKNTLKRIVTHPIIISVVVGMVLFLLKIQLPGPVSEAFAMAGSMTPSLSMLIVGSLLADVPLRGILRGSEVYLGSAMKLIVTPLMIYGLLRLLPLQKEVMQICVILTAMPAAANTAIYPARYGGDTMLASRLVSITTILSIITIPLILLLL